MKRGTIKLQICDILHVRGTLIELHTHIVDGIHTLDDSMDTE